MTQAEDIIRSAPAEICRPWLRHILSHAAWTALADAAVTEAWTLLGHWADTRQAHALFLDPATLTVVPVSTPVEFGQTLLCPPPFPAAAWYERMIHDLWGHEAARRGRSAPLGPRQLGVLPTDGHPPEAAPPRRAAAAGRTRSP